VKKTFLLIFLGVVGGLLGGGMILLASQPPRGNAIRLLPPPTPHAWVVQVSGSVVHPGIYELPAGGRVQDAVQAAGGLAAEASLSGVNLAAPVKDGENIFIPANSPSPAAPKPKPSATLKPSVQGENPASTPAIIPATEEGSVPDPSDGLVNINTATLDEFDQLPGIGPVIAQRIIDYRAANGSFSTIEEIMNVPGIGTATFEKIKALIRVEP
jgi:competence protein ComEA